LTGIGKLSGQGWHESVGRILSGRRSIDEPIAIQHQWLAFQCQWDSFHYASHEANHALVGILVRRARAKEKAALNK
jgi:hypothetical protein